MKKILLATSLLLCVAQTPAHALSVTQNNDANALASLLGGSGITISNALATGNQAAFGVFTDGLSSGLDFNSGIILSSGNVLDAVGPNNNSATTSYMATPGDADLSVLSGFNTNDAALLEFDFETANGNLFFNFIFASEEYNEWVDSSFNDAFGLFVDGVNVALVPGTSTPTGVTINTINNVANSSYYKDNESATYNIQYDGFTKAIQAEVQGLQAGVHTMKFAIADASDTALDSAVFIQAGTFANEPTPITPVPEPATSLLAGIAALGMGAVRRFKNMVKN
ncbi:MAG TPA: choice-of-anchor L domain-containing protein [Candidatus Gastranaerophilales bacterium]|nr:choice-of-anchor L domain-containing protein [Candidatus Gastranaerophilales bacterium]